MPSLQYKEPYTFEEAFQLFEVYAEKYGHIGAVTLMFQDGRFILTYKTN